MNRGKGVGMSNSALPNAPSTSSRIHVPVANQHKSKATKDSAVRKGGLMVNSDNITPLSSSIFDLPLSSSGMKNIEPYIEKTMVQSKQWYRCKWTGCNYDTTRSDSIVRHMRKHTGDRPYKCWFCSYATIQSSALKIHMRRHTGEKPYICKFQNCGKRFAVQSTLAVHERTHTGFKPYKCSYSGCTYSGNDRSKLVLHLRKTHGIDVNNDLSGAIDTSKAGHPHNPHQAHYNGHGTPARGHASAAGTSGQSLALVSGGGGVSAPSSSGLLMNSMYNPFAASSTNSVPLNLLSVFGGATNYENLQNDPNISSVAHPSSFDQNHPNHQAHQPKQKQSVTTNRTSRGRQQQRHHPITPSRQSAFQQPYQRQQPQQVKSLLVDSSQCKNPRGRVGQAAMAAAMATLNGKSSQAARAISNAALSAALGSENSAPAVNREENSINRVMDMVRKTIVGSHALYFCKWNNCNYQTNRSDAIVRHIRSHTGEKPYRCNLCSYATIQRCTLTKHMAKHREEYALA